MNFPLVPGIAITVFIGCQALFVQAQEVDNIKHDQPSETSDVTELETPDIDNTSSEEVVEVDQDKDALNSLSLNAPTSITSSVGIENDDGGLHLPSEIFKPHNIGNTGAFTYNIGFTVPSFRGLEPNIGLSYSSSSLGLLKDQNIVATGWKLSGLSSIERVSEFGGVPWYEDDADVFKLDGMELLACNDAEATNPWTADYPEFYKSENTSASCLSGGNFVTLKDGYQRILAESDTIKGDGWSYNGIKFTVTLKDGTQYVYESLGKLAAPNISKADGAFNPFYNRKWLLTEIQDAQIGNGNSANPTGNRVFFNYAFEEEQNGLAHRPSEIRYAQANASDTSGYRVLFHYKEFNNPLSTFAIGAKAKAGERNDNFPNFFGRQHHRLKAVEVRYGASNEKNSAYQLSYKDSEMGYRNLLEKVTRYGSDYTIGSNGGITGGSSLPPYVFEYAEDTLHISPPSASSDRYFSAFRDVDHDGRVEYGISTDKVYSINSDRTFEERPELKYSLNNFHTFTSYPRDGSPNPTHNKITDAQIREFVPSTYWVSGALISGHDNNCFGSNPDVAQMDRDPQPEATQFRNLVITTDLRIYDLAENTAQEELDLIGELPTTCIGELYNGHWVDINGDGVTEILDSGTSYANIGGSYKGFPFSEEPEDIRQSGYLGKENQVVYGDVNGDGNSDAIIYFSRSGRDKQVQVALSNGSEFLEPEVWIDSEDAPSYGPDTDGMSTAFIAADMNGDGLQDLVLAGYGSHTYYIARNDDYDGQYSTEEGDKLILIKGHLGKIFLSNGRGFEAQPTEYEYPTYVADLDNDGFMDLAYGIHGHHNDGLHGPVLGWGDPDVDNPRPEANILTRIINQIGGITDVTYTTSTLELENGELDLIPGVQRLVKTISIDNGLGQTRATEYSYSDGNYDHLLRKPLGYATVRVTLPSTTNQTPVVLERQYNTDNYAKSGSLISEETYSGTTLEAQIQNEWNYEDGGQGPYRALLKKTINSTLFGSNYIETTTENNYNIYGEKTLIKELGFTSGGLDLDTPSLEDNRVTKFWYVPNLDRYIVDKVRQRMISIGTHADADWSKAVQFEEFLYDDQTSSNLAPLKGNITKVRVWKGDPASSGDRRTISKYTYDNWGNVISEADVSGNTFTYTYDTDYHLFITQTENPIGHTSQTSWNTACQKPKNQTDENGKITSFQWDPFCRSNKITYPTGREETSQYYDYGLPDSQYKVVRSPGAGFTASTDERVRRQYFNGFGEVYKTSDSGATEAIEDASMLLHEFDLRGNVSWVSNPMPWAWIVGTGGGPDNYDGTTFDYDALNRIRHTTMANGDRSETSYMALNMNRWSPTLTRVPVIKTSDGHCFDSNSETVCNTSRQFFDAFGNIVRTDMQDIEGSDVDLSAGQWNVTKLFYDALGQLTLVKDPRGQAFNYSYDIFGNRITSQDPGLGTNFYTYNNRNLMTKSVDPSGNIVDLNYDDLGRIIKKTVTPNNSSLPVKTIDYSYDERSGYWTNIGKLTTAILKHDGQRIHEQQFYYDPDNGLLRRTYNVIDSAALPESTPTRSYWEISNFSYDGTINRKALPITPSSTTVTWGETCNFDAASRLSYCTDWVNSVIYDDWGNPIRTEYDNGVSDERTYDAKMGWLKRIHINNGTWLEDTNYTRTATGRISQINTSRWRGYMGYTYDYAGRLLSSTHLDPIYLDHIEAGTVWAEDDTQVFTYDKAGRMRSNSHMGTPGSYTYTNNGPSHAPNSVSIGGMNVELTYDSNGNMLQGLNGQRISYDAENLLLEVEDGLGIVTRYVYGVDGARLAKIENFGLPNETITAYIGSVEIRNYGKADLAGVSLEKILTYPAPGVRVTYSATSNDPSVETVEYLHGDHLGSIRLITNSAGLEIEDRLYLSFGTMIGPYEQNGGPESSETKGFIGERFDSSAGLQYLNARYYDPDLALYLPPD